MSASPQLSKAPGPIAERRRSPRRSIVEEQIVAVTLDSDNGGLMIDLAENGVAVQAVTPLQTGKTTEMAFALGERRVPIRAHGVVRWAEPSGRAGIRLLAFSEGSSADIRAALLEPPIMPPVVDRPAPAALEPSPGFDLDSLQKEIAGLEREPALGRLAERTREMVSASGLAIALGSREQMICRASTGAAPTVGVRLQSESGLSGECVRTGLLVRCDDTESDPRVDAEVCRQLDLRSAVLVPILDSGEMRGVLEVFSNRPHAFASDDIRRFERLSELIAEIMREPVVAPITAPTPVTAASVAPASVTPAPVAPAPVTSAPVTRSAPVLPAPVPAPAVPQGKAPEPLTEIFQQPSSRAFSEILASPAIKASAALLVALVLAVVGWSVLRHRPPAPPAPQIAATAPAAAAVPAVDTPAQIAPAPAASAPSTKPAKSSKETKESKVAEESDNASPAEELAIRELPAATSAATDPAAPPALSSAGSLPNFSVPTAQPAGLRVGGTVVPGKLVRRVNPEYPDIARRAHIGGIVVLNAVIRPDGNVGTVQVVSGNPLLARAAVEAVRQWRYEPARLDGTAVQTEASIRLNFNPNR